MSTTTIETPIESARRRIDRLHALAHSGAPADRPRLLRHLDAVQQVQASLLAAAPKEIEEKLGQLRTRLAVAEHALVADVSDEWTTFAEAVEDELRSWGIYLERLQATAAANGGDARARAEEEIAHVRTERIGVHDRLAHARTDVEDAWHEQRSYVSEARDVLQRKADELPGKIK